MSSVLDPPRSPVHRRRPMALVGFGLVAVVAAVLVGERLTPSPSVVDRLTVVNPTVYHLEIDAVGVGRSHSVAIGPIGRNQIKSFEGVIDQGREWIFRFASGPAEGGELRVSRRELEHDQWRVTVPDDVSRRLQAAGIPPSIYE